MRLNFSFVSCLLLFIVWLFCFCKVLINASHFLDLCVYVFSCVGIRDGGWMSERCECVSSVLCRHFLVVFLWLHNALFAVYFDLAC